MYEIHPSSWPTLGRPESARAAIDRRAFFEARMASEYRGWQAEPSAAARLAGRVRGALDWRSGRVEACATCPA